MTIRWVRVTFALLLAASAMGACSVDRADMASSTCMGLSCREDISQGAATDLPGTAAAPDASAPSPALTLLKVVCGAGSCVPDDSRACADYAPPPRPRPGGSKADAGAGPVATADAGAAGLDGGLDDGGRDPRVDGSFSRPTPQEAAPSAFACQLSRTASNGVERACIPAGLRSVDEACTSSLDCAPGLGCVGSVRSGRCLPYCCGLADTCETGYYCAPRPLRSSELGEADGPLVPVCDRAENCSLGEPANCLGEHCVCAAGSVCSVVRPDGTTACMPEGQSGAGEQCPCKWGYHCSQATTPATCVKTCELNTPDSCGKGVCQSAPLLPEGWGTCVGASPEARP